MARFRQLSLLLWKNFILQRRHPLVTAVELGVPCLFALILLLIRMRVDSSSIDEPTKYEAFSIDSLVPKVDLAIMNSTYGVMAPAMHNITLWYSPNVSHINRLMDDLVMRQRIQSLNVLGFPTEEDLISSYKDTMGGDNFLGAVNFPEEIFRTKLQDDIKITIRLPNRRPEKKDFMYDWKTGFSFPIMQPIGPREASNKYGGEPGYMETGFLFLQHELTMSIISQLDTILPSNKTFQLEMVRFPYPPYRNDKFVFAMQFLFPLTLLMSFIYASVNMVRILVVEKERRIKESMKMMGLSNWLHWTAWFMKNILFLSISTFVMVVLLKIKVKDGLSVIPLTDPVILYLLLFLYIIATISFCFLVSVFFSKANSAAAGAGILFLLTYIPYFFIFPRYNSVSQSQKLGGSLLSNTALSMGIMVISMWEGTGVGVQWENIAEPAYPEDSINVLMIMGMLGLDSVIYLVLCWYIEAVFPGEYGVPQPWYFPLSKTYWCGNTSDSGLSPLLSSTTESTYFEREPVGLTAGIEISELSKVFPKRKIAVKNVSLQMFKGQITVLLGHNGAGKTTTMSMLTGLFPPTSGSAIVNGCDIREDIEGVHNSLGICPQHDVLFDELTVREHLFFFCKLKGYIPDMVEPEVERILDAVGLAEKRDEMSKTLSGGMKRKLSVGMALVGGSQVVMLDEPTSGMDPAARRFTWDLLNMEKQDRTILLTTHFMEEADVLGDKIAIMANGEVQCCGSPLFLKKKYGAGYHLVMVKGKGCNIPAITAMIQTHVPSAAMESNIGMELTYSLPHDSSEHFELLFDELEKNKSVLGVDSYGASITTMEEVFIKVGEYSQTAMENLLHAGNNSSTSFDDSGIHMNGNSCVTFERNDPGERELLQSYARNTGMQLILQQIVALMIKHMLHTWRHRILTLSQLLLPVAFIVISLTIVKTMPKNQNLPPRVLDLSPFGDTTVPYSVTANTTNMFTLNLTSKFLSQFEETIDKPFPVDGEYGNGTDDSLVDYMLRVGKKNVLQYNLHTIVAATFNDQGNRTRIRSYFNNQAYHSPAIALATVDNALLRYYVENKTSRVTVTNYPLPRTISERMSSIQNQNQTGYQLAQDVINGMAFLLASFSIFLVSERTSKSKHLQQLSGVNSLLFWATTFVWNFLNYLVPCLVIIMCFAIFQIEGFSTQNQLGQVFLMFVLHGFAALPFTYCLTFLFNVPSTAYVRLCLFSILGGLACLMSVVILEMPLLDLAYISKSLDWVFTIIFPNYCLGRSIFQFYQNYQVTNGCQKVQPFCHDPAIRPDYKPCCPDICGSDCIIWTPDFLRWDPPGVGRMIVFLCIQAIMYTILLCAFECNFGRWLKYFICRKNRINQTWYSEEGMIAEDSDVAAERERVLSQTVDKLMESDTLVLQQLTKYYDRHLAVDQISLGIQKGECFGLLGLNGAGKSTTFKMLTGDVAISSGDAFFDGLSMKKNIRKLQPRMGYCPQTDSLIDLMTGRETLTMFSRIRGIPEAIIPSVIERLSKMLYFDMHIDKLVKEYSGGNKRKLNTAVALVGDPPIVFLDEPTTGMDPVARRCLWDALIQVLKAGQSVILTSHSMEECEALCTRLVIMVNGKLCCLGSPQHLKNKFGQGFTLLIKVARKSTSTTLVRQNSLSNEAFSANIEQVRLFVEVTFPGSTLKSIHNGLLHYHIPEEGLTWGQVFGTMERTKEKLNVENYSVGQTTLEQVFLNFARMQYDTS